MDVKVLYEEPLSFGWKSFRANIQKLFIIYLLFKIDLLFIALGQAEFIGLLPIGALFSTATKLIQSQHLISREMILAIVLFATIIFYTMIFQQGSINISLRIHDKNEVKFSDFFNRDISAMGFMITWIIYNILITMGYIFIILPGIYLSLWFLFSIYIVVDKNTSPIESFKKSWKITGGKMWELYGALFILNIGLWIYAVIANISIVSLKGIYLNHNITAI